MQPNTTDNKFEPGPDYKSAQWINAALGKNAYLQPLLFGNHLPEDDPAREKLENDAMFDGEDQFDQLVLAAQSTTGVITVSPGDGNQPFDRAAGGVMGRIDTQIQVTIWTVNNMLTLPHGIRTAAAYRSAIAAQVIKSIKDAWRNEQRSQFDLPELAGFANQVITGKDIPNISTKTLTINIQLNY